MHKGEAYWAAEGSINSSLLGGRARLVARRSKRWKVGVLLIGRF